MANGPFKYRPQDWQNYNPDYTMEVNTEVGGVITPERLNHMEEGLVHANMPINIEIVPDAENDITSTEEDAGKKYIQVISSSIEPRHNSVDIIINPTNENKTVIEDDKETKSRVIEINTDSIEPRWPSRLEIQLIPYEYDDVLIIDEPKIDTRKIQIKSSFLNTCAIKPSERDIVLYMDDWVLNDETGLYEIQINIEAEVLPTSFVKFTKGKRITKQQLKAIDDFGIAFVEHLNGTFKATATALPNIDIPFLAVIL